MLAGSALDVQYWLYAFMHYLRLYNVTVHGHRDKSPYEMLTGKKPNLRRLRVFGCRVYAKPSPPERAAKLLSNTIAGIFLGYTKTMKNVFYLNPATGHVNVAQHVSFDEAMNDMENKPPNARILNDLARGKVLSEKDFEVDGPEIEVSLSQFIDFDEIEYPFDASSAQPLHGLSFQRCSRLYRAYIDAVTVPPITKLPTKTAAQRQTAVNKFKKKHLGSYVVSINDIPVFTPHSIDEICDQLRRQRKPPSTVKIVLAPERKTDYTAKKNPIHLRLSELRSIAALQAVSPDGLSSSEFQQAVADHAACMPLDQVEELCRRLHTSGMTPEEQKLKHFTRRNLMKLPNWPVWDAAFDKQLDTHHEDGTLGEPVPRPPTVDGVRPNVLRVHWTNLVKTDGRRKCRSCIDGSKCAAPWLRDMASTYASCVSQPSMRLFFALSAAEGYYITIGDTTNAFQKSPPPTKQCYLEIDDAYRSWYKKRFGKDVDPRTHVIPVLKALQGHPEAGALWEKMINAILVDIFGFQATMHERNLYRGRVDGKDVLI